MRDRTPLRDLFENQPRPIGTRPTNAGDILEEGGKTFKERHKVYGNNFLKVGDMMAAMFPDGLTVVTPEDWVRLELLMMKVVKISRYAENFTKGGHQDSVHDDMVYSAMLENVDEVIKTGGVFVPDEDHKRTADARLAT